MKQYDVKLFTMKNIQLAVKEIERLERKYNRFTGQQQLMYVFMSPEEKMLQFTSQKDVDRYIRCNRFRIAFNKACEKETIKDNEILDKWIAFGDF